MRHWLCAILLAAACDRGHPRDEALPAATTATTPPATAPAPAPARTCTLAPIPARRPAARRVVAIGDLHGDLHATRVALRTAGAIDDHDRWIGGDLVVVQTGDALDRGDDEQAILDLLFELERQATAAGGALIALLGNHELMNAAGDLRYVTPGGLHDFDDVPGLDLTRWPDVPPAVRGRLAALGPGGVYAKRLATHNVIAIVGDTVFAHGGVLGSWVDRVDEVNLSARCWLDGQAGGLDARPAVLTEDDSPVWTRAVGGDPVDCAQLTAALTKLGVKRMVVGHTVQDHGITSACDGAVWRIDVGLARIYNGPIQVLELAASGPRPIAGTR